MNEYRRNKVELLRSFADSLNRRLQVSRWRSDDMSTAWRRAAVADSNRALAYIEKHTELATVACSTCGGTHAHQHNAWN